MNGPTENRDRLLELLSDRALFGLSPEEEREVEQLQATCPDVDAGDMDRIVALLELSRPEDEARGMPPSVQKQILSADRPALPPQTGRATGVRDLVLAALVSAAATWFAMVTWSSSGPTAIPVAAVEARNELIGSANDLVRQDWTPTNKRAAYSGDVVWSNAKQRGYMRFVGLPKNNPSVEQYQLWIFDGTQDERYPIDGGVFDIGSDENEVVIEIDPKIEVRKPAMFAITIEKPGGVVVSDRSRLPLLAKLN